MLPLSERMRPKKIVDIIGHENLLGPNAPLTQSIADDFLPSIIFWGPPGSGKTSIANLLAKKINADFKQISATDSGIKEVRIIIEHAKKLLNELGHKKTILFIDEIHRFNKIQQDALLSSIEKGIITLIGATTENPSFEIIYPLLSRCQVFILNELSKENLNHILKKAIEEDDFLKNKNIILEDTDPLILYANGDARKMLNILESMVYQNFSNNHIVINHHSLTKAIQKNIIGYDKNGEEHYNIISAMIKSIRGSDPNAAIYWCMRMLDAGEDPKFIARRLLILSSEDIGNANPNALLLANNCFNAVNVLGFPECRFVLIQTVIYLAASTKSNSVYMSIKKAEELISKYGKLEVPFNLRNAPTQLMKDIGYGEDYKYAHNYENNFIETEFLPEQIKNTPLYIAQNNQQEQKLKTYLKTLWKNKYDF